MSWKTGSRSSKRSRGQHARTSRPIGDVSHSRIPSVRDSRRTATRSSRPLRRRLQWRMAAPRRLRRPRGVLPSRSPISGQKPAARIRGSSLRQGRVHTFAARNRPVRTLIQGAGYARLLPPQTAPCVPERTTAEECMAEATFCLDQADRAGDLRSKALCLGVAALWQELAKLSARLQAQGTA